MNNSSPKQLPPYGLRMPPDLKERVQIAASTANRSMNAEIVATLEEKYPEPDPLNLKLVALFEALEPSERQFLLDAAIAQNRSKNK